MPQSGGDPDLTKEPLGTDRRAELALCARECFELCVEVAFIALCELVLKSEYLEQSDFEVMARRFVLGAELDGLSEPVGGLAEAPERRARSLAEIEVGRFGEPEDIAAAAIYLASDAGSFVNGAFLDVHGGT